MALDPLEFGTIAAIILVFFLWGPQKIPELARLAAQARREFENASREFQNVSTSIQNGTSPLLGSSATAPKSTPALSQPGAVPALPQSTGKTGDQLLIEAARRLGIETGGKTREQIQEEIIAVARPSKPSEEAQPPSKPEDPAP